MSDFCKNGKVKKSYPTSAEKVFVVPRKWPRYERVPRRGAFGSTGRFLCRLPVDFYLQQLFANAERLVNGDGRTLSAFCSKWGAMEHPLRFEALRRGSDCYPKKSGNFVKIGMPDWMFFGVCDSLSASKAILKTDEMREEIGDDSLISEDECRLAIYDISKAIGALNNIILSDSSSDESISTEGENPAYIHLINAGATTRGVIAHKTVPIFDDKPSNLTNAICNQIIDTTSEARDWFICPCCKRPFKHYQRSESDYEQRTAGSAYCSKKCANNASKEAKAKTGRNRIRH